MVRQPSSAVPKSLLDHSNKVLFIAHLAIGDFTYLQSCLQEFSRAFPHIAIHMWVDELRRTSNSSEWEHLKRYSLYDWLEECPFIKKIYRETYSPALYKKSIEEAQREAYPIVVSLGLLRRKKYANLARKISPGGFVAGQVKQHRPYDIFGFLAYRKLDAKIIAYNPATIANSHISDIYADWFRFLFGLEISAVQRFPFIDIPEKWKRQANEQFKRWGIAGKETIFLNSFSKGAQRNWPLERIIELIKTMRAQDRWHESAFVVNVVPEQIEQAKKLFAGCSLTQVYLFSAIDSFFQLPATLSLCKLVITVETAIMHLANAIRVPVVALMRKNNPEWRPIDVAGSTIISVTGEKDWIDTIQVGEVMTVLENLPR